MSAYEVATNNLVGNITYNTLYRWCKQDGKLIKDKDWFEDENKTIQILSETIHRLRSEKHLPSLR